MLSRLILKGFKNQIYFAWSAKFILLGVQNLFCLECKIYFAWSAKFILLGMHVILLCNLQYFEKLRYSI